MTASPINIELVTQFVDATRRALARREAEWKKSGFYHTSVGTQEILRSLHDLWDDNDFAEWRETSAKWMWQPNADEDYEHLTIIVLRPGRIGWVAADIDVSDIEPDDLSVEGLLSVLERCVRMADRLSRAAAALPEGP